MLSLTKDMDLPQLESAIKGYDGNTVEFLDSLKIWRIGKAIDLLDGNWFNGSYYYDLEAWCTDVKTLQTRVATNPSKQYLVPIDFHF